MDTASFSNNPKAKTTLRISTIEEMFTILNNLGPEPIGEFMRSTGHPPEDWLLTLPTRMLPERLSTFVWPSYVKFSQHVAAPVFVRRSSGVTVAVSVCGGVDV